MTKITLVPGHPVDGKQDRFKVEPIHQGQGGFLGMGGKTQVPHQSLFPGSYKGLESPGGTEDLLNVLRCCYGVELVEIEMIGLKHLQRVLKLLFRACRTPVGGLARQEYRAAVGRQCRA